MLSKEAVLDMLMKFRDEEYKGNIPLKIIVAEKQEDVYGEQNSRENIGFRVKGAYHPSEFNVTLIANNLHDEAECRTTIRHELLGHYGLNTFTPDAKKELLEKVLDTRLEPSLSSIWAHVEYAYSDCPDLIKAEEVFATVAEDERSFLGRCWDNVRATFQKALRDTGLSDRPLTLYELRVESQTIAKGIRAGNRMQQNFVDTDNDQFGVSKEALMFDLPTANNYRERQIKQATAALDQAREKLWDYGDALPALRGMIAQKAIEMHLPSSLLLDDVYAGKEYPELKDQIQDVLHGSTEGTALANEFDKAKAALQRRTQQAQFDPNKVSVKGVELNGINIEL